MNKWTLTLTNTLYTLNVPCFTPAGCRVSGSDVTKPGVGSFPVYPGCQSGLTSVSPGERMFRPLASGLTNVWRHPNVWNGFLSQSCTISLAYSASEISPEGKASELSDRKGCRKSGVSRRRVLIGQLRSVTQTMATRLV